MRPAPDGGLPLAGYHDPDALAHLQWWQERARLLEELVRHLALVYGGHEPVFAGADGRGTIDGSVLERAKALAELYRETVGPPSWVACPTCDRNVFVGNDGPDSPATDVARRVLAVGGHGPAVVADETTDEPEAMAWAVPDDVSELAWKILALAARPH